MGAAAPSSRLSTDLIEPNCVCVLSDGTRRVDGKVLQGAKADGFGVGDLLVLTMHTDSMVLVVSYKGREQAHFEVQEGWHLAVGFNSCGLVGGFEIQDAPAAQSQAVVARPRGGIYHGALIKIPHQRLYCSYRARRASRARRAPAGHRYRRARGG